MSSKKPKVAKLQLKPTTVSTGFSTGTYDPRTGNAGYTLDPTLSQFRDYFYGAAEGLQPTQADIDYAYGLGQTGQSFLNQGLGLDINKEAQDYYDMGTQLLSNSRTQEDVRLADTLFKTGRTGAAVGMDQGFVNPEQFAVLKAREQSDAARFMSAEDRAYGIQGQNIQRGLGLMDSSNALMMRPLSNMSTLFGIGAGIEGLGADVLNATSNFAAQQMNVQQALQANQQAINNAKASGGFGSGLLGSVINAGVGYATGGVGGAIGGAFGIPGLGGSPGTFGSFGTLSDIFSGTSPSSGLFGGAGFGNLVGSFNNTYSPSITAGGSMFGNAPANYGGGTLGPSYF